MVSSQYSVREQRVSNAACTVADPNQVNADQDQDPDPSFHFDANLQHWPTDLHGTRVSPLAFTLTLSGFRIRLSL